MSRGRFVTGWRLPALACFIVAFGLSMVHWELFNTMPDAASAMQTFHGILQHGLGSTNSLEKVPVFGVHLWFVPLVALPLFAVAPVYPTLVAAQAFVLALSVPAAHRLALNTGMSARNANRWTWFWALHPLVLGPHCGLGEGYQPTIFAITPILWSLALAREGKWRGFLACLCLAMACREEVAITTFGIGFWVWWTLGKRKIGWIAMAMSLTWAAVAAFFILSHTGNGQGSFMEKAQASIQLASHPAWGPVFFRIPFFCYLGFIYLVWGGFTRKSLPHLVAAIPLLLVLFLEENWGTCNPFYHYLATLSPIFFLAALLESGPEHVLGRRWQLCWLFGIVCLGLWQGRLIHQGLHGADRKSLVCLESKIPRDKSLALYSPRGAAHFAWGQDLTWMDPTHPIAEFTLIETGRKTPGWWSPQERAGMEDQLAKAGAVMVYRTPKVRLWALRDHRRIECP
ncbi:MAG TPA: DUF2079 domain-containing protein [Fibrobacteria bacterium]|nr:DUF2079 domain-containing protein [Fibrobacteria bacterium]